MTEPVRVGLFGAGTIGREHANYLSQLDSLNLKAVADPMSAGAALAEKYDVPHFDDYTALLDAVDVDAVIVALPNAMHADAALAAIGKGVVPLVEKPIAGNLYDAGRILESSVSSDVPVLVGHQRRFAPDIVAARDFIRKGGLGKIVTVNLMGTWRKDDAYFEATWRRQRGGGPIFINFIHDIDAARYLLGDVESVFGMGSSGIRGFDVPDTVGAVLQFANGAIGSVTISDAAVSPWCWDLTSGYGAYFPSPPPGDAFFISGTEASLALPSLTLYQHEGEANWKTPFVTSTLARKEQNSYIAQLESFAKVVRRDEEPRTSARDGYNSLAVATALVDSVESGSPVTVASR